MKTLLRLLALVAVTLTLTACPDDPPEEATPAPHVPNPFIHTKKKWSIPAEVLAFLDSADGIPLSIKKECAIQICGVPSDVFSYSDIADGRIPAVPEAAEMFDSGYAQIITELHKNAVDINLKQLKLMEQNLDVIATTQLSREYHSVNNLIWAFSQMDNIFSFVKFDESNDTFYLDRTGTIGQLQEDGLNLADSEFVADALGSLIKTEFYRALAFVEELDLDSYFLWLDKNADVKAEGAKLGDKIFAAISKLQKTFPEMTVQMPSVVNSLREKKELTLVQRDELGNALMMAYVAEAIEKERDLFTKRELSTGEIVSRVKANNMIASVRSYFTNTSGMKTELDETLKACRKIIDQSVLAAPTDDELKHLKGLEPHIKTASTKALESLGLGQSLIAVKKEVKATKFAYPASRPNIMEAIKEQLDVSVTEQKQEFTGVDKLNTQALFLLLYSLHINGVDKMSDENSDNWCGKFAPEGISDAAVDKLGRVYVSWQSVRFPKFGVGVMAHELGHIVSEHIQNKIPKSDQQGYDSLRICTNTRHGSLPSSQDGIYKEEDFADFFAAKTIQLIDKNIEVTNYGCELMGENNQRWGTFGLSMAWIKELKGSHSSNLHRTIQLQVNSGRELPSSCQKVVNEFPSAVEKCTEL